ncbi:hypothetical protein ROZALSC1DRAFT_22987 [Rozella allomycis CSF55]|uniref:Uncharacterized protein n=1 Tax=Rozella allomycis (strain CSF55) TaxID=988480 RepID=A0A4V1IZN6_ROZAC|nr:hypothetical protein ROZALSC1DRAFT_22987 [Rozella allomycis CSF55]
MSMNYIMAHYWQCLSWVITDNRNPIERVQFSSSQFGSDEILEGKMALFSKVTMLMKKFKNSSGPYSMFKRYGQIKSHLHHFPCLLAENLEAIMFLKLNDSHWTVHTVADALKALKLAVANNENDTANDDNNKDSRLK